MVYLSFFVLGFALKTGYESTGLNIHDGNCASILNAYRQNTLKADSRLPMSAFF